MDGDKTAGQEVMASQSNSIAALFTESGQVLAATQKAKGHQQLAEIRGAGIPEQSGSAVLAQWARGGSLEPACSTAARRPRTSGPSTCSLSAPSPPPRLPKGREMNLQAPRRAPVAREGGAGGGGRLVSGLLGPAAGLMARAVPGSGASSLPLLLALALGLVILHCVVADGNSTRSPENDGLLCGDRGENCPATTTQPKRRGHFSRCPKQYKHYCIKGRCRFVVAEQTPSCVCDEGYAGARCERVDLFYLRGDRGQILVICLIAVMVIFIILVVGICTCCHPLRKHRERIKKEEEMETLVYEGTSRLVASYKIPYSFENGQTVSQENS
ncbi:probetacellulin [Monodon monoceros]|uniref:probetacellulin n=1 Tax=Monodon monoceros TaxID=40151 RepID=UPI0010FA0433|nr:probetacellulin [Monodon monoceros]